MILFCHGNNCIALYNEIRPQFDFLDRVDISYFPLRYYSIFQFLWVILYKPLLNLSVNENLIDT
jgi:hypothetical protein